MSECKHVEHRAGLNSLQLRGGIDEPLVPGAAQADQDGDVLFAIDRKRHRRSLNSRVQREAPQGFPVPLIDSHKVPAGIATRFLRTTGAKLAAQYNRG